MARPKRIGKPLSERHEQAIVSGLRPMIRQVRATLPLIDSAVGAQSIAVALARQWGDARIRALVERVGRSVQRDALSPLIALERAGRTDAEDDDPDALLRAWVRENVARITSVRDDIAEQIAKDLVRAARDGTPAEDLTAKWLREGLPVEWGTAEGRLKTIARDQVHTLAAQIQSARARSLGVEEFVWRTQGDERVRDRHRELDGKTFRYDAPPSEGLPGQPINCRCWAESVVPADLFDLSGAFGVEPGPRAA